MKRYKVQTVLSQDGASLEVVDTQSPELRPLEFMRREAAEESCAQLNEVWEQVIRELKGRAA